MLYSHNSPQPFTQTCRGCITQHSNHYLSTATKLKHTLIPRLWKAGTVSNKRGSFSSQLTSHTRHIYKKCKLISVISLFKYFVPSHHLSISCLAVSRETAQQTSFAEKLRQEFCLIHKQTRPSIYSRNETCRRMTLIQTPERKQLLWFRRCLMHDYTTSLSEENGSLYKPASPSCLPVSLNSAVSWWTGAIWSKKKKRFHYHVRVSISLTSREANLSLAFYILVLPPLSCCSYLGG